MINLLPPGLKEQRRYGEYNRIALRYVLSIFIVLALVAASFMGAWIWLDRQETELTKEIESRAVDAKQFGTIERDAKALADRLGSIEKIQNEKTRYPALLEELGNVTPPNAYIFNFSVDSTGKTMNLTVYAENDQAVASFKNALEASPRFRSVALGGYTQERDPYDGSPTNRVVMTVSLEDGALK